MLTDLLLVNTLLPTFRSLYGTLPSFPSLLPFRLLETGRKFTTSLRVDLTQRLRLGDIPAEKLDS
jgi:hypothetical protein